MDDVCVTGFEDLHFRFVYMHAVDRQGFRAQYSEGIQPLHNAHAGFIESVLHVLRAFSYVDMESYIKAFRCLHALSQGLIRERHLCMEPEHAVEERAFFFLAPLDEPYVLFDALIPYFKAVSVRYFICQRCPDSRFQNCFCTQVQASRD